MDKRGRSLFYLTLSIFLIFLFIIIFLSYTNKINLTGNVIYSEVSWGDVIWKFTTPFYNFYDNTNDKGYGFLLSLWNSSYSKASTEIYPDEIMSFNFSYQYSTSSPKSYNLLIKNSSGVLFRIFVNCNVLYMGRSGVYISGTNGEKLKTVYSKSVKNSYCDPSFFGGGFARSIVIDRTKGNLSIFVMNKNFLINDSSNEALSVELTFSKPKKDYDNVYVTNFFVGDKEFPFIAYPLNEQSYLSVSEEDIKLSLVPKGNKYYGGVVYYFASLSEEDYLNSDFPSKGYGRLEPGEVYLLPANVKVSESPDRSNEHFIMETEYYVPSENGFNLISLESTELTNQKEVPVPVSLTAEALYQQPDSLSLKNSIITVSFISSFMSSSGTLKDAGVISFKKPGKTKPTPPKPTRPTKPTKPTTPKPTKPQPKPTIVPGNGEGGSGDSGSSFVPPVCPILSYYPQEFFPSPEKCVSGNEFYRDVDINGGGGNWEDSPTELFSKVMTDDKLNWIIKKRTIKDASGCEENYELGWTCEYEAKIFGSTCTTCKKLKTQECSGTSYPDREEILVSRLPGVPMKDVGCCVNAKKSYVGGGEVTVMTQRRPYDTDKYMCCPSGAIVKLCKHPEDWKGCKRGSDDYPGISFSGPNKGGVNDDGCCPIDRISEEVDKFLKKLSKNLDKTTCFGQVPVVTAAQSGCHSFQSLHYSGCSVDINNINEKCLEAATGYPVVDPPKSGLWPSETCFDEGSHFHCNICSNYPAVIGEDIEDEKTTN